MKDSFYEVLSKVSASSIGNDKKNLTLVTGGARAGKSELAELMASQSPHSVYYLATMQLWADDAESVARIDKHRRRRPPQWRTIESPLQLDSVVRDLPPGPGFVIIDCLSLYVSNMLLHDFNETANPYEKEPVIARAVDRLMESIKARPDLQFVVVTNEVGLGIVPENSLARAYRDILGAANRTVGQHADSAWLVVCGLNVRLK